MTRFRSQVIGSRMPGCQTKTQACCQTLACHCSSHSFGIEGNSNTQMSANAHFLCEGLVTVFVPGVYGSPHMSWHSDCHVVVPSPQGQTARPRYAMPYVQGSLPPLQHKVLSAARVRCQPDSLSAPATHHARQTEPRVTVHKAGKHCLDCVCSSVTL